MIINDRTPNLRVGNSYKPSKNVPLLNVLRLLKYTYGENYSQGKMVGRCLSAVKYTADRIIRLILNTMFGPRIIGP